jgi:hypothetical protein
MLAIIIITIAGKETGAAVPACPEGYSLYLRAQYMW